jgi:hypothetical protein
MNPTREELERLGCSLDSGIAYDKRGYIVAGFIVSERNWFWIVSGTYRPRFRVKAIGVE